MKKIDLKFDSKPKSLENLVNNGHEEYEKSNGIKDDYKEFYITITHDDSVVGVLSAYIVFAEIYIDDLWIDKKYRRKGYGTQLLDYLYTQYENKGFNNINLVTSEFQAPDFYIKNGYELEYIRKTNTILNLPNIFLLDFLKIHNNTKESFEFIKFRIVNYITLSY